MFRIIRYPASAAMIVAILVLLLSAGVLFFHTATKVEGAPVDAFSRFRDGPVKLTSSYGFAPGTVKPKEVASLDVPEGLYVIFAKGVAKLANGSWTKLDCALSAGTDFDRVRVGIDASLDLKANVQKSDESPFALNVLHRFTSPGTISLKCICDADDVDLSFLKITALHVNSYLNTPQ